MRYFNSALARRLKPPYHTAAAIACVPRTVSTLTLVTRSSKPITFSLWSLNRNAEMSLHRGYTPGEDKPLST